MAWQERTGGDPMTHLCCPPCRLRFTSAAAAHLGACPNCGQPPQPSSLRDSVGFRIFRPEDDPHSLPQAIAASIPVPDQGGPRS
jgi:hypothetical protein